MSNRVVIQEGYTLPFAAYSKKRKAKKRTKRLGSASPAMREQQNVMKACAKKAPGGKAYRGFMSGCLKAGGPQD
jgi:hypothetical protein